MSALEDARAAQAAWDDGGRILPSRLATMAMPAIRKARSLHKRNNRGFVKSPRIVGWQRDGAS